ncbi:MAG TPA: hypothetical protein VF993_00655, partial [Myxococcales bacterium]
MEDPQVFEQAHRIPLRLLAEGKINGLRIDHPDGLAYPMQYFRLLQHARILQRAQAMAAQRGLRWEELEPAVREELESTRNPALWRPLYVVAEKILGRTESLPEGWAVAGTTGYDFLNNLNGIFVARDNEQKLQRIYSRFIGGEIDFEELVYQKKKLILYTAMASEMNLLARQLNRISEGNRWTRDFTLYSLRAALIEVVACFPVYRTYIEEPGRIDERDRRYILQAVSSAKRRNPAENASIYDFIADILLQKFASPRSRERSWRASCTGRGRTGASSSSSPRQGSRRGASSRSSSRAADTPRHHGAGPGACAGRQAARRPHRRGARSPQGRAGGGGALLYAAGGAARPLICRSRWAICGNPSLEETIWSGASSSSRRADRPGSSRSAKSRAGSLTPRERSARRSRMPCTSAARGCVGAPVSSTKSASGVRRKSRSSR